MFTEQTKKRIKKKMIDRGYTLTMLAKELNETRSYVSNVINHKMECLRIEYAILKWIRKGNE